MQLTFHRLSRFFRTSPPPPVQPDRDTLLRCVTEAVLRRELTLAEDTLRILLAAQSQDAAALNLFGAVCELRGNWKSARKYYGRARSVDPTCEPSQQNLRRWYELFTFGRTCEPLALHEEILFR